MGYRDRLYQIKYHFLNTLLLQCLGMEILLCHGIDQFFLFLESHHHGLHLAIYGEVETMVMRLKKQEKLINAMT